MSGRKELRTLIDVSGRALATLRGAYDAAGDLEIVSAVDALMLGHPVQGSGDGLIGRLRDLSRGELFATREKSRRRASSFDDLVRRMEADVALARTAAEPKYDADYGPLSAEALTGHLANARAFLVEQRFVGPHDDRGAVLQLQQSHCIPALGDKYLGQLLDAYTQFAERRGFAVSTLYSGDGCSTVLIDGPNAFGYFRHERGDHFFISNERASRHKKEELRNRTHLLVTVTPQLDDLSSAVCWDEVEYEPIQGNGPGGQHVNGNKTGTRLRYTHIAGDNQEQSFEVCVANMRYSSRSQRMAEEILSSRVDGWIAELEEERGAGGVRKQDGGRRRVYDLRQHRITDRYTGAKVTGPKAIEGFFQGNLGVLLFAGYGIPFDF